MAGPWEDYAPKPAASADDGPWNDYKRTKAPKEQVPDPTEGMGTFELSAAGVGKSVADLGRSLGQGVRWLSPKLADAVGAPTQADIDEAQRLDAPLVATVAGMAGNIGGNLAMSLLPGTGQIGAASKLSALWQAGGAASRLAAVGGAAGMGAAQNVVMNPRGSDDRLGGQVAGGAAMGAVGQLAGPLLAAGIQGARNIKAGSLGTTGRTLQDFAGVDPAELTRMIKAGNTQLVPGSATTTVQATQIPGLARLKSVMNGMYPNEFAGVDAQQNAARVAALNGISEVTGTAADAANNAGNQMFREAAVNRDAAKALVRAEYNHPSLDAASIALPSKGSAMSVLNKFYPGQALGADEAGRSLAAFAKRLDSGDPIPLKEFDALRKIAGNKAADMRDTDRTAAAAWGSLKGLFDGAEAGAIVKSGDKFAVTGQGPWGDQFGNLAGDPQNAIAHLLRMGRGEVPLAATNQMAGPVGFVAGHPAQKGSGAFGLMHIDAHGRDDVLRQLPQLAAEGTPYSRIQIGKDGSFQPKDGKPGRYFLGDGEFEAVLRNSFDQTPSSQWNHTAYRVNRGNELPVGNGQLTSASTFTGLTPGPGPTASNSMLPDITASFKAFDQSLGTPTAPRDPRQYVGGLLAPDQAQHLQTGRQLHGERIGKFDTGFAKRLWVDGADGMPKLTGGEIPRGAFNSGATQTEDIAQWALMGKPGEAALKNYAITGLMESAAPNGLLSPDKVGKWTRGRSEAIKGLLDTGEQATLSGVNKDLQRAAAADALELTRRQSNTTEKLTSLGLLDNGVTDLIMKSLTRLPAVGGLVGVGFNGSKEAIKRWKYKDVPDALIDPEKAMAALKVQAALMQQTRLQRGLLSPYVQQGMVPAMTSGD